jgi:hypothetical protein
VFLSFLLFHHDSRPDQSSRKGQNMGWRPWIRTNHGLATCSWLRQGKRYLSVLVLGLATCSWPPFVSYFVTVKKLNKERKMINREIQFIHDAEYVVRMSSTRKRGTSGYIKVKSLHCRNADASSHKSIKFSSIVP